MIIGKGTPYHRTRKNRIPDRATHMGTSRFNDVTGIMWQWMDNSKENG